MSLLPVVPDRCSLSLASVLVLLVCRSLALPAAENKTAVGIITSKTTKPAGVYEQYPAGKRGGFSGPSEIPIAESVVFEIKVDGLGTVRYAANAVAARQFEIGQKVQVTYVKRAIMPWRKRIYVLEMQAAHGSTTSPKPDVEPGAAGARDANATKAPEH